MFPRQFESEGRFHVADRITGMVHAPFMESIRVLQDLSGGPPFEFVREPQLIRRIL